MCTNAEAGISWKPGFMNFDSRPTASKSFIFTFVRPQ